MTTAPVTMRVTLMAHTTMTEEGDRWIMLNARKLFERMAEDRESRYVATPSDGELLAEIAGRLCYLSFHLPNPQTSDNKGYIHNIRRQMHYSVLEHMNYTFMIEGVSRRLTHELVRHRMVSPSQLSQRYVDHETMGYVLPPVVAQHPEEFADIIEDHRRVVELSRQAYKRTVERISKYLVDKSESAGQPYSPLSVRKTARDAAAYVLTEGTETKIQVTANGRAWIEFLSKRDSPHAADEIHMLATQINWALKTEAPNIFREMT